MNQPTTRTARTFTLFWAMAMSLMAGGGDR